ncbi:MAG TPA: SDR family oxidoreductase, partial [Azospirillaceae bacterium]|nr:SDR family oxidoreductase [Azospirillaceae bacterium]
MRHVIVTGGSRGLGLGIVKDLLARGDRVSTCSRKPSEELEALLADPAVAARLWWRVADMGDQDDAGRFVQDAVAASGGMPLWGLVNNAGIAVEGILSTLPMVDVEHVIRTNLIGPLAAARAALRQLLRQDGPGRIVNIGSITGLRGYTGLAAYAASKSGLDGMTRALAREVGRRGITVNAVAPGYMSTDLSATLSARQLDQIVRRTPLGRLCEIEDVVPV